MLLDFWPKWDNYTKEHRIMTLVKRKWIWPFNPLLMFFFANGSFYFIRFCPLLFSIYFQYSISQWMILHLVFFAWNSILDLITFFHSPFTRWIKKRWRKGSVYKCRCMVVSCSLKAKLREWVGQLFFDQTHGSGYAQ